MELKFGNITTAFVVAATTQLATLGVAQATGLDPVQQFVTNELLDVADTAPQDTMSLLVGEICPAGVIDLDSDLQDRCNDIAGAAINDDLSARDGLQAMAPEEDAVIASSQVDSGSAQVDNIGDRMSAIRSGSPAAGLTYLNRSGFNWSTGAAGDATSPWGFFVNGLYVNTDRDSTSREAGFEADDFGVTGGIDYAFSDKFVFGLAFGYKDSDADIDNNGGDLETESLSYFAYWSLYPDEFWYIDAMVGYTDNDHDQKRNVIYTITGATPVNNAALSETDSDEISVSVTAGRNFFANNWTLSPYGRIEYADIEIDGFTEQMAQTNAAGNGLALQIDDQDFESLMMTIGASASTTWAERYFPRVSVEYVHEFKNNNDPITGRFVNDTSRTTFTLLTDPPDRNFVNVGAGLSALLTDDILGYARYQGLFGYKDLDVHAFEVGLRIGF